MQRPAGLAAALARRVSQAFTDVPDVAAVGRQIVENVPPVFKRGVRQTCAYSARTARFRTVVRHHATATRELNAGRHCPPAWAITGAGPSVSGTPPCKLPTMLEDDLIQVDGTGCARLAGRLGGRRVGWPSRSGVNGKTIGAFGDPATEPDGHFSPRGR